MALAFILVTVFIDMLGLGLLIPVIPFVVRQFTTSAFAVGALSMSFALFQFFAAPVLGRLSDRYGRRPLLLFSLLGSAAGYVVFGLARSLPWLFAARIVDGISGGNVSIAQAYIADVTDPAHRSRNFGLLGAAFGLGFIIGPALGGVLSHFWGLSAPAFFAAGLALLNTTLGYFVLPETRPVSVRPTGPFSLAGFNPMAGVLRALTHEHLGSVFLAMFVYNIAFTGWQSNISLFTLTRFHWGPQQNAVLFTVVGIATAIVQGGIVRRLAKAYPDQTNATAGLALQTVAYLVVAFAHTVVPLYIGSVLTSVGVGVAMPMLQAIVSTSVSDQEQGLMLGTTQSVSALTRVIGPLLAGLLFDAFGPNAPYWSGAVLAAVGTALIMRARPRRHQPA